MIGTRVVKIFEDDIAYTGWVKAYDAEEGWYKVVYDDGDEEDMTLHELRVPEWKPIDRRSVLWLDEKHKEIVLGLASKDEWQFTVDPDNDDKLMKEADGGVREPPRPCTRAKYMGQCREMIGVTMIEGDDGKLKGVRIPVSGSHHFIIPSKQWLCRWISKRR